MSRTVKTIITIAVDIVLIAASLITFALFHHVLPQPAADELMGGEQVAQNTLPPRPTRPTSNVSPAPSVNTTVGPMGTVDPSMTPGTTAPFGSGDPGVTAQPTYDPSIYYGQFGEKFGHLFQNDGTIVHTQNEYRSQDIYINIYTGTTNYGQGKVVYHVADIYIRYIDNLKTRFANDTFGRGYAEDVRKLTYESGGIVGLSGDMSSTTRGGIVIRNGKQYSARPFGDVCVLYMDGTMRTFYEKDFDINQAMKDGAYQAWDFGPKLLGDNGEVLTTFNSRVKPKNPRGVIGYFEPGHYCFVAIDGRDCSGSVGTTMQQTAQLMHDLGCKQAFNLDGGESAVMAHNNGDGNWENDFVNVPYNGGRPLSDIIYIAEYTE